MSSEPVNGETLVVDQPSNGTPPLEELTPAAIFKQKVESSEFAHVNGKNKAPTSQGIDLTSSEAFPTLGNGKAPKISAWVAKVPLSEEKGAAPADTWRPKIAGSVADAQQTLLELTKENKRPASELKKSATDIVREIMKKTGTKIDSQLFKDTGATVYIILGPEAGRFQARRLIAKELAARRVCKIQIPAQICPFVIGKKGAKIQEIQAKTSTNVKVQAQADNADVDDETLIDIIIEGDAEGCEEAHRLIKKIVSERVIKITRRITCPGEYYPFIAGPFSKNIEQYETEVDKVYVPEFISTSSPPPVVSPAPGPIEVIGEKSAVEGVVAKIEAVIALIRTSDYVFTPVAVGPFKTQLFVRNNARLIHELREETDCTVIAPPEGRNIQNVYIYGPMERRADALSAVYRKADQFRVMTLDLCKPFAKAPVGAKTHARNVVRHLRRKDSVRKIERESNVELTFPSAAQLDDLTSACNISIIGALQDDVNKARASVISVFGAYTPERLAYVNIEPLHHKHVLGGKGPSKIGVEQGVELLFPEDPEEPQIALVYEGSSQDAAEIAAALEATKEQVHEAVKGQADISSITLDIPEELHDKVRGERGTTINALNPSSAAVQFGVPKARPGRQAAPSPKQTKDTITLRGPPSNVEATKKNILSFLESTKDKAVPETVTIPFEYNKQYSGNLIGQKGANINKLRDDLGVDIKLTEGHGEIKGIQVCVDAAKRKLLQQLKELEDKAVLTIKVPQQYHSTIIGSEGSTVRRLEERYGVRINFPKAGKPDENGDPALPRQAADEIVIRGNKKGAEDAKQEVAELWKYEAENSYMAVIKVSAGSVGYMFKNSSKDIKQLRDESSARISIPQEDKSADPASQVEIKIRGTKAAVAHAQKELSRIASQAENTSSRTITVDKKYHRSLIGPAGATLKSIVVGAGGSDDRAALARLVRFPSQGSDSDEITVQGNSAIVNKIVESIEKIVAEKASQITETIEVAPEKHRKLIGREGSTRRELESKFSVTFDIPRQRPGQPNTSSEVKLTGTPEAVAAAKEHILELVKEPEGETVDVPKHLHHAIADTGLFKLIHSKFKVSVDHAGQPRPPKPQEPKAPQSSEPLPLITDEESEEVSWQIVEHSASEVDTTATYPWVLHGTPENITNAKAEIEKALQTAKKQSCTGFLVLPDPRKYRFVVGPGGGTVDGIRRETGCKIMIPRNQAVGEAIVLHGDKEGLEKAKEKILEIVKSRKGDRD